MFLLSCVGQGRAIAAPSPHTPTPRYKAEGLTIRCRFRMMKERTSLRSESDRLGPESWSAFRLECVIAFRGTRTSPRFRCPER